MIGAAQITMARPQNAITMRRPQRRGGRGCFVSAIMANLFRIDKKVSYPLFRHVGHDGSARCALGWRGVSRIEVVVASRKPVAIMPALVVQSCFHILFAACGVALAVGIANLRLAFPG